MDETNLNERNLNERNNESYKDPFLKVYFGLCAAAVAFAVVLVCYPRALYYDAPQKTPAGIEYNAGEGGLEQKVILENESAIK